MGFFDSYDFGIILLFPYAVALLWPWSKPVSPVPSKTDVSFIQSRVFLLSCVITSPQFFSSQVPLFDRCRCADPRFQLLQPSSFLFSVLIGAFSLQFFVRWFIYFLVRFLDFGLFIFFNYRCV